MLALLAAGCGEDAAVETPESPSSAEVEGEPVVAAGAAVAVTPPSEHGGTVVAVGPYFHEVVALGDGGVEVFVHGSSPALPPGSRVSVRLTGDDGAVHPVALIWDPAQARYRGILRQVHAIPGPIQVTVVADGQTHRGEANTVVVTAPPDAPAVVARSVRTGTATTPAAPGAADPVVEAEPEPVAVAPEPEPEPIAEAPPVVQVQPAVVARPPAATPALGGGASPILDRRARATGVAPRRARADATEGATVQVRQ